MGENQLRSNSGNNNRKCFSFPSFSGEIGNVITKGRKKYEFRVMDYDKNMEYRVWVYADNSTQALYACMGFTGYELVICAKRRDVEDFRGITFSVCRKDDLGSKRFWAVLLTR